MIKVGDYVKFKKHALSFNWAITKIYRVIGMYQYSIDIIVLDDYLIVGEHKDNTVYMGFMDKISIKRIRMKKLKQIFND